MLQQSDIFIPSKYMDRYNKIITRAIGRPKLKGITEAHHIIPKSMGGTDDDQNIVNLTFREHYLAHLILTKCCYINNNHKNKMLQAFWFMCTRTKQVKNSRLYQNLRSKFVISITGQNSPNYGRKHSEKQKQAASIKYSGEGNPMYGKRFKQTKEWCDYQSKIKKGIPWNEKRRKALYNEEFRLRQCKTYELISPNNEIYIVNDGLDKFCKNHNLNTCRIRELCRGERILPHRGWKAKIIN
jgi:hypothetical protein